MSLRAATAHPAQPLVYLRAEINTPPLAPLVKRTGAVQRRVQRSPDGEERIANDFRFGFSRYRLDYSPVDFVAGGGLGNQLGVPNSNVTPREQNLPIKLDVMGEGEDLQPTQRKRKRIAPSLTREKNVQNLKRVNYNVESSLRKKYHKKKPVSIN